MTAVFFLIKKTIGLRVTMTEEVEGLDIHEHGLSSSYADFMPFEGGDETGAPFVEAPKTTTVHPEPIHALGAKAAATSGHISKISIVFNESRFEELKDALNKIGITGMTVSKVMGCGVQKGSKKLYRGAPVDMNLLPKLRAEVVVANVPVNTVIETA